jgi:poly-gamma-glutamate capsule biosynthesis protein CapA/YwtB (metallophosphatase superfamily)
MAARIVFLGDVLLGRSDGPALGPADHDRALGGLRPLLDGADLVVANLEGPITGPVDRSAKAPAPGARRRWWMRSDPGAAEALARAGVRVVSLANNHVMDFGEEGLVRTLEALRDAGITACGAGAGADAASRAAVVEAGGVRVGFVAAMQEYRMYVAEDAYARDGRAGPALLEVERLSADAAALRGRCDAVVALVHWGRNYRPRTAEQRRLARACAPAFDLVVGHHPHVPQRMRIIAGTPVLYSLGNAAYGMPGRFARFGAAPYGLVAVAEVEPDRGVTALAVALIDADVERTDFTPRPAEGAEADALLDDLLAPRLDWVRDGPHLRRAQLRARARRSSRSGRARPPST